MDAELASINARLGHAAPLSIVSWDARSATARAAQSLHALQAADSDMDRELKHIEEQLKSLRSTRAQPHRQGAKAAPSTSPQSRGEQPESGCTDRPVGVGVRPPRETSLLPAGSHHNHLLQRRAAHTALAPLPAPREPTYEEFALGKGRKGGGGPFWYLREGSQDDADADASDVFQIRFRNVETWRQQMHLQMSARPACICAH